jgi:hypothetical protein
MIQACSHSDFSTSRWKFVKSEEGGVKALQTPGQAWMSGTTLCSFGV